VKACMRRLSSSGMVHNGGCSVAECGPVASEMGGVVGLLVYITKHGGPSASFPIVTASFSCSGISSKEVTTNLAALFAKLSPLMFVWPQILCSFVGTPRFAL